MQKMYMTWGEESYRSFVRLLVRSFARSFIGSFVVVKKKRMKMWRQKRDDEGKKEQK
jgi:hypothetical protein